MTEHVVQLAGGAHFIANSDENLLTAAQRAHWLVRYGCRNGNCQACAATLLAGSVLQGDTAIAASGNSSILLCLCHAQSDLRIELPGDPLHGSSAQARRHYARVDGVGQGENGGTELHLILPAGRTLPVYPGQYFLLEYRNLSLRAEIDTERSKGRDLYLRCATAQDFGAERYLGATGPLGYCYAATAAGSLLILRDSAHNIQAGLLRDALPHARLCDGGGIGDYDFGDHTVSFDTVLACTRDPQLAEHWYYALLERGIAFDEFRSDTAIRYRWRVWRQDDNGNRFALGNALSERAARHRVDDYHRRGHKQLYWAEPMMPLGRPS
jgi:ferredoxin